MRRLLAFLPALAAALAVGCGSNTPTEYTGPALTPLTGKSVPQGMGPPGEGPADGQPKGPPKPPGVR